MQYKPLPTPDLPAGCDSSQIPEANETPACPVCGSEEEAIEVGTKGRYRMDVRNVVCRTCAMCFQSPRPDAARMATYYSGAYRDHYGDVGYPDADGGIVKDGDPGYREGLERWHDHQARNALSLGETKPGERVLEIGCRHARTLGIMKETLDIVPQGIEPGPEQAEEARAAGIPCFNGILEDFDPGDTLYDQIQLFHVLEHLHEPLETLIRLRSWLSERGRLVIEVPNVTQPYGTLEGNFFQNAHLTNFAPHTLVELARRAGLHATKIIDSTTLFVICEREETEAELPLPFEESRMDLGNQPPERAAACLRGYAELEDLRLFVVHCELNMEVLQLMMEVLKRPCFLPHMIETVSQLTEELVRSSAPQAALLLAEAAAAGPHPMEVREGMLRLKESVAKLMRAA